MAKSPVTTSQRVDMLETRLDRIEQLLQNRSVGNATFSDTDKDEVDAKFGMCSVPVVPERTFGPEVSDHRARLIHYLGKKWVNGTRLTYAFFKSEPDRGDAANMALVRKGFKAWQDLGIGISFEEVDRVENATIRIGFRQGDGSWSYVGRDVRDVPGPGERTMNFGWDLTQDPRGGGLDTPIHEIGHTLGFPHEHQNPFAGIVWDEEAVYRYFAAPPNNWPRETTYHNVIRKIPNHEVQGSSWDPNSIMHYAFGAGLIISPPEYSGGITPDDGLSDIDIEEVRKLYPPIDKKSRRELSPLEVTKLGLAPGEQADFSLKVERTDRYTIQTFGKSDVVMVLFQETADGEEFVAGNDDSGTDANATLSVRLIKGQAYVLRLRMILDQSATDAAIMFW